MTMFGVTNTSPLPRSLSEGNRGCGTFSVISNINTEKIVFELSVCVSDGPLITLEICPGSVALHLRQGHQLQIAEKKTQLDVGSDIRYKARFWLSLDSHNGMLRYGKYFPNRKLTLLKVSLDPRTAPENTGAVVWDTDSCSQVSQISLIRVLQQIDGEVSEMIPTIADRPVTCDPRPYITSPSELSLSLLASGDYTAPSTLHVACQELYEHIAATNISLNDGDFPDFAM
jgi:hypothetical protein